MTIPPLRATIKTGNRRKKRLSAKNQPNSAAARKRKIKMSLFSSVFRKKAPKSAPNEPIGDNKALISVDNVTLSYDGKAVIENLSFSVEEGDLLCIIGENGSGKSSLIGALSGMIKPTSGKISFSGIARNQIGILPQQATVSGDSQATVREIVTAGCLARSNKGAFMSKESKAIVDSNLALLNLTHLADRRCRELSGGQCRKVMLARALCSAEKLLLLDEAVAGLDRATAEEVYTLISQLNRGGMTIVMITSDTAAAHRYATKLLCINKDSISFKANGI